MQNSNEHRILLSTSNQHTNSDSFNQNNNQISQMECDVHNMAISENKERQDIHSRCGVDCVPINQNYTIVPTEGVEEMKTTQMLEEDSGYTYSYMVDKLKRNPEEMIDQINFSDEEEDFIPDKGKKENMTSVIHDTELKNICDLYEEDASMTKYTGTKNEIDMRKEIPIPFELTPTNVLLEAGIIDDIIEDRVIIKANAMNGTLDLDNIIFTINKIAFGYIDDVIGKVDEPIYIVKYFPNVNISSLNLRPGQSIYNIKDKSKYIEHRQIYKKGCDASNAFDEEVLEDEMEFSDDEEEMTRRVEMRKRKKIDE